MIVLVILAAAAGMVVPRLGGVLDGLTVRTAAGQVAASLRYLRSRAVTDRAVYQAFFQLDSGRLRLRRYEGDDETISTNARGLDRVVQLPDGVVFREARTFGGQEMTSGRFQIAFYPSGGSNGGRVIVGSIRGDARQRRYALWVDLVTGTVTIHDDASKDGFKDA